MTAAHLTPAQARALGIPAAGGGPAPRGKTRSSRRALPRDGAVTRCHTCGETFTTTAAETRHVDTVHGGRFETVLT